MRTTLLTTLALATAVAAGPPDPVALVNGEPIRRAELDAALSLRPPIVTPLSAAQMRELHREVLAALVDERLVHQFLRKHAPPPDAAKLAEQWRELERGLAAQKKTLADFCKETQQTEAQLKANLATALQWHAYAAAKLTDAAKRQFHADNKDFFDKTTVRASHIVIRCTPGNAAELQAATTKLRALRADIAAGKLTFAEAAIKHSQCPSAPKGGDLGGFARQGMVEEPIAKAAFALQPGELSESVVSDFGVHLLQVTDRKAGPASSYELVKDDVRATLLDELRQSTLTELRRTAKVEIKLP